MNCDYGLTLKNKSNNKDYDFLYEGCGDIPFVPQKGQVIALGGTLVLVDTTIWSDNKALLHIHFGVMEFSHVIPLHKEIERLEKLGWKWMGRKNDTLPLYK